MNAGDMTQCCSFLLFSLPILVDGGADGHHAMSRKMMEFRCLKMRDISSLIFKKYNPEITGSLGNHVFCVACG